MPPSTILFVFDIVQLLFVFAFGACVGSLLNVIAYRMPLGIGIVSPPSRCPHCETRLSFWKDNIPVFGWILLKGKCRYCRTRISAEYPLVEATVGLIAVAFYLFWYVLPPGSTEILGVDLGAVSPDWTLHGTFRKTWPVYLVLMGLIGSLAAMTLVDAKTCMIPLGLAWFPTILAVVVLPIYAWYASSHHRGAWMPLPTPGPEGWPVTFGAIGAIIGLGISILLVKFKILTQSFADYEAWEKAELAKQADEHDASNEESPAISTPSRPILGRGVAVVVAGLAGAGCGFFVAGLLDLRVGVGVGGASAIAVLIAGIATRPKSKSSPDSDDESPADL
ncbi:MAG: prepilin peptidase, partial [Phycisphaerales bacterium]|nr:prepilin peptidase [Phycisphaerales bacterium]